MNREAAILGRTQLRLYEEDVSEFNWAYELFPSFHVFFSSNCLEGCLGIQVTRVSGLTANVLFLTCIFFETLFM